MKIMKFRISNKSFYKRHNDELEKYSKFEETLHIVNSISKEKIDFTGSDLLIIDFKKDDINQIKSLGKLYDRVILTDVIEVSNDIYNLFKALKKVMKPNGKLIVSSINTKWSLVLKVIEVFKVKDSPGNFSYIHNKKVKNIANGVGLEYIKHTSRQFIPFKFLFVGSFINKMLEATLFFLNFGIKTYIVFKNKNLSKSESTKTIIVPAKNEEGNLEPLINRIPKIENYEIIIACGKSKDKTLEKALEIKEKESFFNIKVIEQTKTGKANAVWESLDIASGDLIAILDADISVDPETIPDFFDIIDNNEADFVNGTRLIYPMEKGAMRLINLIGNRIFQGIVGFIIKENLTDSLCGTKVFKKSLIPKINWWQKEYKVFDPFGDFDLLFTAAFTGEKIIEYPIHYRSRSYGKTQISRFRDGFKLIRYLIKSYLIFNTSTR